MNASRTRNMWGFALFVGVAAWFTVNFLHATLDESIRQILGFAGITLIPLLVIAAFYFLALDKYLKSEYGGDMKRTKLGPNEWRLEDDYLTWDVRKVDGEYRLADGSAGITDQWGDTPRNFNELESAFVGASSNVRADQVEKEFPGLIDALVECQDVNTEYDYDGDYVDFASTLEDFMKSDAMKTWLEAHYVER